MTALWRFGLEVYHRSPETDICLNCPVEPDYCIEAAEENPTKLPKNPTCPYAYARQRRVPIAAAAGIAGTTLAHSAQYGGDLALLWYRRGVDRMVERKEFMQMLKNNCHRQDSKK